jgi:hypothetical protein
MAESSPGEAGLARRGQRARPVVRTAWAALLAALVLLGGLEFHPAAESRELLGGFGGPRQEIYFPGASHPARPPHAETSPEAQRPFCAVCLSRLQGSGAPLAQAARLSAPLAVHLLPAAVAVSPLQLSRRPDGARAPPLA